MPSLAGNITNQLPFEDSEPLVYPKPPECFLSIIGNVTDELAYFIFHAKAKGTYEGYTSYVNNYISFCKTRGVAAFPTTPICLAEWAAIRARPSMLGKAMKADSILSALSAIRWAHIVRRLSLDAFNDPFVKLAVEGIRRVQGNYEKKKALPLSKMQLAKITSPIKQGCILSAKDMDNLNIDAAFKCAFAGFLRTAEITYEKKELKNPTLFERNHLLRRDVHFSENYDHAILSLRASKADTEFKGIEILLSSDPHSPTCAVTALRNLFERDPQPLNAPLFRISSGAFPRDYYISTLRSRLQAHKYTNVIDYAGHSFRRGAAQHASDNGLLDEDIQRLGRWSSDAFKGYFAYSNDQKFLLHRRFITGRLTSLTRG